MAMSFTDRMQKWKLLRRDYTLSNQPSPGNVAIFFDEDQMAHAGVIIKWPLIMAADSESGIADQMDAFSPPLAGKEVRFYSRIATQQSNRRGTAASRMQPDGKSAL